MIDPSAFRSAPVLDAGAFASSPIPGEDVAFDPDGLVIPEMWRHSPNWPKLAVEVRRRMSREYLADLAAAKPKQERPQRPGVTRFTTDAAIKWGRRQGWKLIDRESYDFKNKRHHDCEGGCDAIFDDGQDGRVGVQGAGKSERKTHFARFTAWGGAEKAQRRHLRVIYLEFERGSNEPVKLEHWA